MGLKNRSAKRRGENNDPLTIVAYEDLTQCEMVEPSEVSHSESRGVKIRRIGRKKEPSVIHYIDLTTEESDDDEQVEPQKEVEIKLKIATHVAEILGLDESIETSSVNTFPNESEIISRYCSYEPRQKINEEYKDKPLPEYNETAQEAKGFVGELKTENNHSQLADAALVGNQIHQISFCKECNKPECSKEIVTIYDELMETLIVFTAVFGEELPILDNEEINFT